MKKEPKYELIIEGTVEEVIAEAWSKIETLNILALIQGFLYILAYATMWVFSETDRQKLLLRSCPNTIILTFVLLALTGLLSDVIEKVFYQKLPEPQKLAKLIVGSVIRDACYVCWVAMLVIESVRLVSNTERLLYGGLWIAVSIAELIVMTIAKGGVVTRKIVAQYIEIPNVSPNESSPSTSEATLMQNVERPVAVTTEKAEDQTVGYRCRDFEDKYYHFRLKTPCFNSEGYKGISYYVERLGDKAEFLITHFNEGQESELYNASEMDTAISALTELHDGKVGKFMLDMCGMTLDDCHLETDERIIAGLDAVRFTGIYYFESFGGYWSANAVGYCIRGKHTPVLLVAIDMSAAQDHLSELSAIIDEMAGTYIDGTGLD